MGIPASFDIFCSCRVKFLRDKKISKMLFGSVLSVQFRDRDTHLNASSLTVLCGAKHAMAHTRISIPVKNCFPRMSQTPAIGNACCFAWNEFLRANSSLAKSEDRPPYCSFGGGRTLPRTSIILFEMVNPNSCANGNNPLNSINAITVGRSVSQSVIYRRTWTYESLLKSALLTKLFISLSLSGADLAVAFIIVLVCMSVNFLIHLKRRRKS